MGAMAILTNVLADLGKKKNRIMTREDMFSTLNDVVSILASSHNSVSFIRKLNVKPLLHEDLQVLSTKKAITDKKNNDLLFGESTWRSSCKRGLTFSFLMKDTD